MELFVLPSYPLTDVDELLLYIFELLVQDAHTPYQGRWSAGEDRLTKSSMTPKQRKAIIHPELVLSAVCRRWRDLAVQDPLLWDRIAFRSERTPFVRSQAYLARSQQAVIAAEARVGNAPRGNETELENYFNGTFSAMFPHLGRCRHIGLQAPSIPSLRSCLRRIMENSEGELNSLRSIELGARQPDPWGDIMEFIFHNNDGLGEYWEHRGTSITTLTLRGVLLPWTWFDWYSNLTELTLTFRNNVGSPEENSRMPTKLVFLQILSRCPDLETLELTGFRYSDPAYPGTAFQARLRLESLTSMRFSGVNPEHLGWLLAEIEAPNLRYFFYRTQRASLFDVREFLLRYAGPGSSLKGLWVNALPGTGQGAVVTHLHDTLSFLPALEELTIQNNHIHHTEISALTPRSSLGGPPVQCPKLKVLRLISTTFSFRNIANMVRERKANFELASPMPGQEDHRALKLHTLHIRGDRHVMRSLDINVKDMMRESVDNLVWDDLGPLPTLY